MTEIHTTLTKKVKDDSIFNNVLVSKGTTNRGREGKRAEKS
jgi:hypothetical protein